MITTNTLLLIILVHTKEKIPKNCKKTTKKIQVLSKITKLIDKLKHKKNKDWLCEEGKFIQRKLSGAKGCSRAAQKRVKVITIDGF